MEDNIHEDKLDDYVRQSFEGYEEDPSDDLWGRVEAALPPAEESPKLRLAFLRYRWQVAAAVVILLLLSTLVCERRYYEQRLRAVSEQAAQMQAFSHPKNLHDEGSLPEKNEAAERAAPPPTAAPAATAPSGQVLEKKTPQHYATQRDGTAQRKDFLEKNPSHRTATQHDGTAQREDFLSEKTPQTAASTIELASPSSAENAVKPATIPLTQNGRGTSAEPPAAPSPAVQQQPENSAVSTSAAAVGDSLNTAKNIDLERIASHFSVLKAAETPPALLPVLPLKARREPSGWYLGAQATVLAVAEKSPAVTIGRPGGRPLFVSQQGSSETSAIWWLKVGKRWGSRFTLESGAGYQKTERTATHTPRFRFADGTVGGLAQRTFNYGLSTYGGTAEVTLRMEQTNPGTQPTGEEPVPLRITTSERREQLRVPLTLGYHLGDGRWRSHLKAGLVGNFLLKNDLDISARVSQNARFRPVDGRGGYAVQLNEPSKFSLGYLFSAGAEYRFNRYLSAVAEPTFMGDFARQDAQGQQLPQHISMGLNLGVGVCF